MIKYIILNILTVFSTVILLVSCKVETVDSHLIEERTISVNGNINYYAIAVPYDYNENNVYPIFIALHWGGDYNFLSGSNFLATYAMKGLAHFNGIIIAPSCPASAGWIHGDSESLIFTLIEKIKSDYSVDTTKIVIGGYSMGGVGTWYYASTYPDIFKVAVPISSSPPNYMLPIKNIVPTYVIHGTDDEEFPLQTVKSVVHDIKVYNNIIRLVEVEGASHYQTDKFIKPLAESIEWIESYLDL